MEGERGRAHTHHPRCGRPRGSELADEGARTPNAALSVKRSGIGRVEKHRSRVSVPCSSRPGLPHRRSSSDRSVGGAKAFPLRRGAALCRIQRWARRVAVDSSGDERRVGCWHPARSLSLSLVATLQGRGGRFRIRPREASGPSLAASVHRPPRHCLATRPIGALVVPRRRKLQEEPAELGGVTGPFDP